MTLKGLLLNGKNIYIITKKLCSCELRLMTFFFFFFTLVTYVWQCSLSFRACGMLESLILVMKVSFVVHFAFSCHGNKNLILMVYSQKYIFGPYILGEIPFWSLLFWSFYFDPNNFQIVINMVPIVISLTKSAYAVHKVHMCHVRR